MDMKRPDWHFEFFSFICFSCLFNYFERERERVSQGWGERGRERVPGRLRTVSTEPDAGLDPTNCEIMTQVEIKSQMLNLLSHPGAQHFEFLTPE